MNNILEQLIEENKKLIFSIIKEYNTYIDVEDLYQVSIIGLKNAWDNFDKNKGTKFSTYAYIYIYGEIKKYLRENRTFKITKDMSLLCNKINKAKNIISQKLMREPTVKELAEFLNISEYKICVSLGIQYSVQSLDEPVYQKDNSTSLYDIIPNKENTSIDELIMLKDSFSKLDQEEKRLIQYRYFQDRTQSEVATILGLSQVKVSREEKKVLTKLRNNMQI